MANRNTKKQRSRIMSRIHSKNTSPELKLRKAMLKAGLRGFKMHPKMLGNPDFVFPKQKVIIFVDGCFWHGYNWKKLGKVPPRKYWQKKILGNMARDKKYNRLLRREGWKVLRFWEFEIKIALALCIIKIEYIL